VDPDSVLAERYLCPTYKTMQAFIWLNKKPEGEKKKKKQCQVNIFFESVVFVWGCMKPPQFV